MEKCAATASPSREKSLYLDFLNLLTLLLQLGGDRRQ